MKNLLKIIKKVDSEIEKNTEDNDTRDKDTEYRILLLKEVSVKMLKYKPGNYLKSENVVKHGSNCLELRTACYKCLNSYEDWRKNY